MTKRLDQIIEQLKCPDTCEMSLIAEALDEIKRIADDGEAAHGYEDDLRDAVLEAIADGAPEPHKLAFFVRKSSEIKFSRWI